MKRSGAARSVQLYKSPDELRRMVQPGIITRQALDAVRAAIRPGVTTGELDSIAESVIRSAGAEPNFMMVADYRHTICASVNDDVVHGIPGVRIIAAGDIVSIDCGALLDEFNGDSAFTVVVPDPTRNDLVLARESLSKTTEGSLWAGIAALSRARHLGEVGGAIEDYVTEQAELSGPYGILEGYVGHGIGRSMHEPPSVYNYRVRERGPRVRPGLVVAIEPMVTAGSAETFEREDGWTVATSDGSASAHWEHTVAVHAGGIWVLTSADGGAAALADYGVTPVPLA